MSLDRDLITGRLNVNDYLEARKGDIQKIEHLLSNSGANAKKRAFQSLPRTERRRAASHDPKRVPRKRGLRKRAEIESIRDNSKKPGAHQRSPPKLPPVPTPIDVSTFNEKAKPPSCDTKGLRYGHRQRDKIWLPTHVWHKKRAHMVLQAGTIVPLTASQKQFRRTYRLMSHIDERGAMAWDSSYYVTFVVRNAEPRDLAALFPHCDAPLFVSGKKLWQGIFGNGPASLYWFSDKCAAIQCNPLLFDKLWDSLAAFEREDCRYAVGNIDLMGPKKFDAAARLLNVKENKTWSDIVKSGIAPSNFVMYFMTEDPRVTNHGNHKSSSAPGALYSKETRQESLDTNTNIPAVVMLLEDGRLRLSLPRSWVLPFWLSLFQKRSILLGGQLELNQLALEKGLPCFPYDFPDTEAGSNVLIGPKQARTKQFIRPKIGSDRACHVAIDASGRGVPMVGHVLKTDTEEGVVTSGNYGYSKAKGIGIGLMSGKISACSALVVDPKTGGSFAVQLRPVLGGSVL